MFDHLEHHSNMIDMNKCDVGKMDGVPVLILDMLGMRGL